MPENERVEPADRAAWRAWLESNWSRDTGISLVLAKGGRAGLSYEDAVLEAVAFGWIDSKANTLDERRYLIWMSPRKPKSGWSASNKQRVATLEAQGLMAPPGIAAVEVARANGSWGKLDAAMNLEVPDDLSEALDTYPSARSHFEGFPVSARRAILEWISQAKRPETRARRVTETARLAAENIRANDWRPSKG